MAMVGQFATATSAPRFRRSLRFMPKGRTFRTALCMLHVVRRIVLAGLVVAIAVAIGGWALGRSRFGASDREAVARLETELRDQFLASATALGRIATDLAAAERQATN